MRRNKTVFQGHRLKAALTVLLLIGLIFTGPSCATSKAAAPAASVAAPAAPATPTPGFCFPGAEWETVADPPAAAGPYEGAYSGRGAGGQYITVFPKLDLVVAHKTHFQRTRQQTSWNQYHDLLVKIIAAKTAW